MSSHLLGLSEAEPAKIGMQAGGAERERVAGEGAERPARRPLRALTLAAIGVVYGDIGTSPLYALREALGEGGVLPLTEASVLGVLSLISWSLFVVVTFKYVIVVLRVDNRGEGGAFWRSPRSRTAPSRRVRAAP